MTLNEDLSYNIIEDAFKEVTNMNTGAYQKYFQFKLLHNGTIINKNYVKYHRPERNSGLYNSITV